MFATQNNWAFVDKPLEPLLMALRPTSLSHDKGIECRKQANVTNQIRAIGKTGADVVEIRGTPTFVIDGKVYGGELSLADLTEMLKPLAK